MDLETSIISIIGLSAEMFGLFFLFLDLHLSK